MPSYIVSDQGSKDCQSCQFIIGEKTEQNKTKQKPLSLPGMEPYPDSLF